MESAKLRLLGLLVLAVALGACGDEPEADEARPGNYDLRIRGMEGTAHVSFDENGVLHARCLTDGDCLRVLGYFHASSRFFQMDLQRRAARGRLGTLIPFAAGDDPGMRAMFSTPRGEPLEEEIWRLLSQEERDLLEAYSQGINAWLEDLREGRNGARLSEEYGVTSFVKATPQTIPPWEPLDTVAFARLMTFLLSDSSSNEIALGQAFARLASVSPEAAFDYFNLRPAAPDAYTLPAAGVATQSEEAPELAGIEKLAERLAATQPLAERALAERDLRALFPRYAEAFGSNNWVLGPSRTRDGKAILANDPHLELSNAPIFYLANLDAVTNGRGTLHVAGATFPGIPAVVIGRNERVAWGATVAYFDVMDVYVETLTPDGRSVYFEGEEVEIVRKEVVFEVANENNPQLLAVLEWVPHHGPIISKDESSGLAYSVRWTGHEPSNELRAFLRLNQAGSVGEAKEALENFEVGAQNFVLADVEGAIGWYPHARIPSRPWASYAVEGESLPPWMPLPGDGSAEWEGYLAEDEIPQAFDPPAGFIATANQDLTGETEDGDPTATGRPMLQSLPAPGLRMARILDLIEEGGNDHTVASNHALQMDDHSLLGEWIVPKFVGAADGADLSPEAEMLLETLASWDLTCPTGLATSDPNGAPHPDASIRQASSGCAAFHFTLPRLFRAAFGNRQELAGLRRNWNASLLVRPLTVGLFRPGELLQSSEQFWTDLRDEARTEEEVLVEALEVAAAEIVGPWGRDPEAWLWGRVHTVRFETRLTDAEPSLDLGPFAAPGGLFTVNVANPSIAPNAGFEFRNGASLRIVNELGEEGISTWIQLPGGQDLHRDSPHYGDWIERWLVGEPTRLPFTVEEVAEAAEGTLRVGY